MKFHLSKKHGLRLKERFSSHESLSSTNGEDETDHPATLDDLLLIVYHTLKVHPTSVKRKVELRSFYFIINFVFLMFSLYTHVFINIRY